MSLYFDNAATTPIDDRVIASMLPLLKEGYQNPSSPYRSGRLVREAIEKARLQVANLIGAKENEVIFTSGGTEANNHAIKGIALMFDKGVHFITSVIEHHSVLDAYEWLEDQGYEVTYLPVDSDGIVDLNELKASIKSNTKMISIMWANNEIGSVQPIEYICEIAKERKVLLHVDAVQAMATIDVDVSENKIDLLSFSSHKIYGPKGCGCLYIREGTDITPLFHGGMQNHSKRGGTEATYNIVGFGKACELLKLERESNREMYLIYKRRLIEEVLKIDGVKLNGSMSRSLTTVVNIGIENIDTESLLIHLDMCGIQASLGAACNSKSIEPSHVLKAIGLGNNYLKSSIRISFGRENKVEDLEVLIEKLIEKIQVLRRIH